MYWFQKKSYQEFHAAFLAEVNECSDFTWINSSYSNDACGSVMFDIDNNSETYVQLFAFETKADAIAELEEFGTQYAITVSINGGTDYTTWDGDDRAEAIKQAEKFAKEAIKRHALLAELNNANGVGA
jgi:VCBS repeat-containing protein